jgi:hypothetical protein
MQSSVDREAASPTLQSTWRHRLLQRWTSSALRALHVASPALQLTSPRSPAMIVAIHAWYGNKRRSPVMQSTDESTLNRRCCNGHRDGKCCSGIARTAFDVASAAIDAVSTVTDVAMQYFCVHRQRSMPVDVASSATDVASAAINVASAEIDTGSAAIGGA